MKAWTLILFFVCFNLAGFIISNLVDLNVIVGNKDVMPYSYSDIGLRFDIFTIFSGLLGVGLAGLIGWLTHNASVAVVGALIWMLGIFLGIIQWFTSGFPIMLGILLNGTGLEFMAYVAETVMLVFFFFFLAGILAQRDFT